MPGPDFEYTPQPGAVDLYPQTELEHAELLAWCQDAFTAAESHRRNKTEKWRKYHRVYRSYVDRDVASSWRSALHIPYAFAIVEGIAPKMVAQLPSFVCYPRGPEDVIPAKLMEAELERDSHTADLYVELIKAIKTSLKFGTGLLKNYYDQQIRRAYEEVPMIEEVETPVEEPAMDENGQQMVDIDGNAMTTTTMQTMQQPVLDEMGQPRMELRPYSYVAYEGPSSKWVDPFNFYVAPEASSLEDARYVIERILDRTVSHIEKKIREGVYRLPPGVTTVDEMWDESSESAERVRKEVVGEDSAVQDDQTRKPVVLDEYWTSDGRLITVLNQNAIIRVSQNPYWHGEYPYCDFPDYLQEGEFWGIGEIEAIEGLQDLMNAIVNQRVDNLRMVMDAMFAVNAKAIEDERDLVMRPGGVVRIAGDYLPSEAIERIDLGDVTSTAFAEASEVERMMERVSSMSAYQTGVDSETMNRTATGVSLITEAGNTKFAMKVRLMELVGLKRLARQWGSIIQQFFDEERAVRISGPNGQWLFPSMTPEAIQGQLDYSIDIASTTQNETVMKEQALELFQTIAPAYPPAVPKLVQDLLEAFGKKDVTPYMMGTPDLMLYGQMMQGQQSGGMIIPFPQQEQRELGEGNEGGQSQEGGETQQAY